jgi:Protein of unknown function (DUF1475)
MIALRAVLIVSLAGFCGSFFWAGSQANIIVSLAAIFKDPWGAVTFLDLYAGLGVVAAWIFFVERQKWVAAIWTVALLLLGNFATILYLLIRSFRVKEPRQILLPQ